MRRTRLCKYCEWNQNSIPPSFITTSTGLYRSNLVFLLIKAWMYQVMTSPSTNMSLPFKMMLSVLALLLCVVIVGFYVSVPETQPVKLPSSSSPSPDQASDTQASPATPKIPITPEEKSIVAEREGLESVSESHKVLLQEFDKEEQLLFAKDREAEQIIIELEKKVNEKGSSK